MKRVVFESAPEFIVLCIIAGLGYAAIQYFRTKKQPWSVKTNWLLFFLRASLTFVLAFLLMGPIVKQLSNFFEKPHFIVLYDNSASIKAGTDTVALRTLQTQLSETKNILQENGYETLSYDLSGELSNNLNFNATHSDLNAGLKQITNRFEGQNIGGVILVSDGIYNAGLSPLYADYNFPVHTIGVGDTVQRMDIAIKNVAFNKIAYQGNKFPVRAEVQTKNVSTENISVSVYRSGKLLEKQTKKVKNKDELIAFDFQPLAEVQGLQKLDIQVDVLSEEENKRNNRASAFVEVVEGKKKILLVAPSPHPDIKAIREVVEKNANYDFLLHIPGVQEQQVANVTPDKIDLVIFYQSPDMRGRTNALFQSYLKSKTSLFFVFGQQSDLNVISKSNLPVKFESTPREIDEVTPVTNGNFSAFSITAESNTTLGDYPPAFVHFGKVQLSPTASLLLQQRVGNVITEKPLLVVEEKEGRKMAVMLGEGFWRWKLNEYDRHENTNAFDEVFGKLIQYLSTTEDKRKFKSYPLQQEFSDTEPVVFESQVYNEIFEPVYGNKVEIDIINEAGEKKAYTYVTSEGNIRYQIGGLKEGVYKFRSRTLLNNKMEEIRGEFAVIEQQAELQNLTADHNLLRKISDNTGGKFYKMSEVKNLQRQLTKAQAKSIIHTQESFDSLINLKWLFFVLLIIISLEWFLRKFHGAY